MSATGQVTVALFVGTRPNFMKVAPVLAALRGGGGGGHKAPAAVRTLLIHTGQHYDARMSEVFFDELGLPKPDHYLGVGSGGHAAQTAAVLTASEAILVAERPDLVVVPGDVNSTLAAALAAAKLQLPVAHIEAGLRSRDRSMPEEINRVLTDQLSELLFVTSADACDNLRTEGIPDERVFFVGNPMIDSLERHRDAALARQTPAALGLEARGYALVTLHRPANVDDPERLRTLADVLTGLATRLPVVFPVHPRTRAQLLSTGLLDAIESDGRLLLCEPLGYLDFVGLMAEAAIVLTDSGGIQEETTVLGVPCLTLRPNTERPVTIWQGTNRLVDPSDAAAILSAADETLIEATPDRPREARRPELWDGHAGERIAAEIVAWTERRPA